MSMQLLTKKLMMGMKLEQILVKLFAFVIICRIVQCNDNAMNVVSSDDDITYDDLKNVQCQ